MKLKSIASAACAVALSASLMAGLSACSSDTVAATVGSVNISEEKVTNYIQGYRTSQGLEEDSDFAMVLGMYGMTPADFRESVINLFVNQELVKMAAKEKGISVDKETIDVYVNKIRSNYSDDASWQNALKNAGLTEQEYRDNIEYTLMYNQLTASFGVSAEPTEEQVLTVAKDNLKYFQNAKRSSHVLFDLEDEATAQEVLGKIKDGTLSFEDAAAEYSKDSSSENGGDVGWDALTTFVDEYQQGLDALSLGEVSDLVKSQFGYHIIKCTEVMPAADKINALSDLPEAFQSFFTNLATIDNTSSFGSWLNGYKSTVSVKINPMPKKLPYDVDMSAATTPVETLAEPVATADTDQAAESK